MKKYNTLTFIGDKNDSLAENQYIEFIVKCIKEYLNDIKKGRINKNFYSGYFFKGDWIKIKLELINLNN